MDMNNVNIEEIVKQVLSGMTGKGALRQQLPHRQLRQQTAEFRKLQELQ